MFAQLRRKNQNSNKIRHKIIYGTHISFCWNLNNHSSKPPLLVILFSITKPITTVVHITIFRYFPIDLPFSTNKIIPVFFFFFNVKWKISFLKSSTTIMDIRTMIALVIVAKKRSHKISKNHHISLCLDKKCYMKYLLTRRTSTLDLSKSQQYPKWQPYK